MEAVPNEDSISMAVKRVAQKVNVMLESLHLEKTQGGQSDQILREVFPPRS